MAPEVAHAPRTGRRGRTEGPHQPPPGTPGGGLRRRRRRVLPGGPPAGGHRAVRLRRPRPHAARRRRVGAAGRVQARGQELAGGHPDRPGRRRGPGGGAGRRGRRLPGQAVPLRRAAGAPAGAAAPRPAARDGAAGGRLGGRPGRAAGGPGRTRGRPHPARVRGAGLPPAAQERGRHPGDARPGRVEGPRPRPDQRHRRVRQLPAAQGRAGRPAAPHLHPARRGLQPAGGAMSLSIRWRLTLWYTLVLAAALCGFSSLVYGFLARALAQGTDRALQSAYREVKHDTLLASDEARLHHRLAEVKKHENIACVVYDPEGKVLAHTEGADPADLPPAAPGPDGGPRLRQVEVPGAGPHRALEGRLRWGAREHTIVLLAPLRDNQRELRRLLRALFLSVPAALLLTAGAGYLLARKALAPVGQLRRLTEEITASSLDRRLPVRDAGDEIGRLAQTINAMIGRLERSFAEVRRFTADASHELRTPLTAIRTEAEVALGQPLTTEEHRNLLGSILEECGRL